MNLLSITKKYYLLLLLACAMTVFSGCDDDDPVTPIDITGSITSLVSETDRFSLLETAIVNVSTNTSSDLATLFSSTDASGDQYTVFAPNNSAFTAAGYDQAFLSDAANATAILGILQYHVVAGETKAAAVPSGPNASVATLQSGSNLFLTSNESGVFVNGNSVIAADIDALNGVIHEVNAVLAAPSADLVGAARSTNTGDYSLLVTAILNASTNTTTNVAAVLSGTDAYTVFAPDNAAFIAAGFDYEFLSDAANASAVLDILLYHVISGNVPASAVPAGPNAMQASLAEKDLFLTSNTAGVFVNGAQVTNANVTASNGTLHGINALLTPPSGNVVEKAQATASLSALVAAITYADANADAGLATALSSGTYTVFAPNDAAFLSVFDGADGSATNGTIETAELDVFGGARIADILKLHVVPTRAFSSDLSDNQSLTTLFENENLTVGIANGTVSITGSGNTMASTVTAANIVVNNGVLHMIDQVLLPTTTIVDLAKYDADLTHLVAAIVNVSTNTSTDVAGVLSGTDPYTVFAPSNQAFIDAGFDLSFLENSANAAAVLDILLYHVLTGETKAEAVPSGPNANLTTLDATNDIYLTRNTTGVFINGVTVTAADLAASNGVIHKIGSVLLPPKGTLVDEIIDNPELATLLRVVQYIDGNSSADLVGTLSNVSATYTVFAPTNAAFLTALDGADGSTANGTIETAELDALGATALTNIVLTHVVSGRLFSSDLSATSINTLATGEQISVDLNSGVTITADNSSAAVVVTNKVSTNGVIHKIDTVLMP